MLRRWTAALACVALLESPVVTAQTSALPTPLSYEAAVEYALAHNLMVDAARRGRAIREANVTAAGQRPNPDVTTDAARDLPHQSVTVDIPIEIGSKRQRRIDVATAELSLADLDVQAATRAMRRQLREQFYTLLAADERVRLAESVVEIATRVRDAAQQRFEAGAVARLEVMQADLGAARAAADLQAVRSERTAAQATLNAVLNGPPEQLLTLVGSLDDHTVSPAYDQALSTALTSNTDLVGLDRQIAIEAQRLALLRAERTPVPVFSAGAQFNNPHGDFGVGPTAALSIGLPIFNRNQGEIAGSIATTAQLRRQREATQRSVENAVFAASARVNASRQQLNTYRQQLIPVATDLETLAEESFQAGRTSVLGVLDAQRSLRDLSREAVQAALDLQMAVAELEELLGTPLP